MSSFALLVRIHRRYDTYAPGKGRYWGGNGVVMGVWGVGVDGMITKFLNILFWSFEC